MKARFLIILAPLFAAILPHDAMAQCSGVGGVPFNCAPGSTPQVGDYVMGGSLGGSNTVKWTIGQLFANPPPITTLLIGNGTLSGFPYQFQDALNLDPGAAGASGTTYRENAFNTMLTYATQNTTNVVDGAGLWAAITVNGPFQANGEINDIHAFMQFNSNATSTSSENFEASMQNAGSITQHIDYLSQPINNATGTATRLYSLSGALTNQNTTAGSIGTYAFLNFEPIAGGGSNPTSYFFMRNNEPLASISTRGGLAIGGLSNPGAGMFTLQGPDALGGTCPVVIKNSVPSTALSICDDLTVNIVSAILFPNNGIKFGGSSTGLATQTFTNSPCTGNTTERWIGATITGQSGLWYIAACQ